MLSGVIDKFYYLKTGLAIILSFVGVKMLLGSTPFAIPIGISLGVIVGVLAIAVIASLIRSRHQPPAAIPHIDPVTSKSHS